MTTFPSCFVYDDNQCNFQIVRILQPHSSRDIAHLDLDPDLGAGDVRLVLEDFEQKFIRLGKTESVLFQGGGSIGRGQGKKNSGADLLAFQIEERKVIN